MRWWSSAYAQGEQFIAAPTKTKLDVFGIARPDVAAAQQRSLVWQGLRPGCDLRIAAQPGVDAVVCSGLGPNDVKVITDCHKAGKAVFVESLERFQPADLAELAAADGASHLMAGLYLRFDTALQEVAELGLEAMVGRPLLYQAHASTVAPTLASSAGGSSSSHWFTAERPAPVTPSLLDLGMQQVDALRFLLKTEPTEVYAIGTSAASPSAAGTTGAELSTLQELNSYQALVLSIKTRSGASAVISLDASGGAAKQRMLVVGDQSRAEFVGKSSAEDLQTAGINHFMDVVTAGARPRMAAADCLHAAAVMVAAVESLHSGAPVAVSYHFDTAAASAGQPASTAAAAVAALGGKLSSASGSVLEGARQLVQGVDAGSPAAAPGVSKDPGSPTSPAGEQAGVSTPPHRGTPANKGAPPTPESPPLFPSAPGEN